MLVPRRPSDCFVVLHKNEGSRIGPSVGSEVLSLEVERGAFADTTPVESATPVAGSTNRC